MLNKKLILSVFGGALLAISAQGFAAQQPSLQDEVVAREASEAPRGADNNNHRQRRGGRNMIDTESMILSRRGADDPPGTEAPGDNHRQRRGGKAIEELDILAREGAASNNQRQRQRKGGAEGGLMEDVGSSILARRGADDPPGTEAPGDNHRQRRGGRNMIDTESMILSRRGADDPPGTERPGDNHRQRRGGRA